MTLQPQPPHPSRPARRGERGAVLFLAMLISVVLSGIILLGINRASLEVAMTGNDRFGTVAAFIAEGGLTGTAMVAAADQDAFMALAETNPTADGYLVTDDGVGLDEMWGTSPYADSFGREGPNIGNVQFETELTNQMDTNRVPGYSPDENCFKRFVWTTTSQYGVGAEGGSSGSVANLHRLAIKEHRMVGYLGPFECGL